MATESLSEILDRLHHQGYTKVCRTEDDGLHFAPGGAVFAPEELKVDGVYRIEGTSAPDEEVVLFAVQSPDGQIKGTFASPHGVDSDPLDADAMQRLNVPAILNGTADPGADLHA